MDSTQTLVVAPTTINLYKTECTVPRGPWRNAGDLEVATAEWVAFYNEKRLHAGIGLHALAFVHYGTATEIRAQRAVTLDAAYATTPVLVPPPVPRRPTPTKPRPSRGSTNPPARHSSTLILLMGHEPARESVPISSAPRCTSGFDWAATTAGGVPRGAPPSRRGSESGSAQ